MIPQLVVWHLGALHPYEKVLTYGLAFGPFLVLVLVIVLRRRQDLDELDEPGDTRDVTPPATPDRSEPPAQTP